MDIKATRETLKDAVENNDFAAFNKEYVDFLSQYSSFRDSYSATPAELDVNSAIFGGHSFYLKQTTDTQAEKMIAKARAASKVLGRMSVEERIDFLNTLEKKLEGRTEELMVTISADTGKPIDLSKGEMSKGNDWFDYARNHAAEQLSPKQEGNLLLGQRPQGAVQMIGAFNYPYALAISGIVGGLAGGNGVIVSAPLKAPNWVFPFMEAAKDAIAEYGAKAKAEGKAWADDFEKNAGGILQNSVGVNRNLTANVDVVHFVGGDVTGEMIRKSRGQKRTVLEMGGSNVVAVMASSVEGKPGKADEIAKQIFSGFGPATGQRCTAPRMLCVQEGAEEVTQKLKEICDNGPAPGTEIGNPFKEGVKMGPLVDRGAHQKMKEAIAIAKELGAEVHGELQVSDNVVPQARHEGSHWVNPIVIDWTNVDMADAEKSKRVHDCMKDEIFGPLLHIVHPVKTLDQAIAVANKLDTHGLAGAIYTDDANDVMQYQSGTNITSLTVNGIPKDLSPKGKHGHPHLDKIGGSTHFNLYTDEGVLAVNGLKIGGSGNGLAIGG